MAGLLVFDHRHLKLPGQAQHGHAREEKQCDPAIRTDVFQRGNFLHVRVFSNGRKHGTWTAPKAEHHKHSHRTQRDQLHE